jgi:hypothetical protein
MRPDLRTSIDRDGDPETALRRKSSRGDPRIASSVSP